MSNFLKADCRLTLLGESIADLLEILCLFGADRRPTLPGESMTESCLTLQGVKGSWSHSSAESTLYLVDRATVQFGQFLLPLFLREKVRA